MTCFFNDTCAWALLIIRLLVGITFVLHGSQKVFGLFGGPGLSRFAEYITTLGFPGVLGYCAAFTELIGGVLLVFGIVPKIAAFFLILVMLVALWKVHLHRGLFIQNGGYEYVLNLIILLIVIIIAGPGKWSVMGCASSARHAMAAPFENLSPDEKEVMEMVQTMTPEDQQQFFTGLMKEVEAEAAKLPPEEQRTFLENFWADVEKEASLLEKARQ